MRPSDSQRVVVAAAAALMLGIVAFSDSEVSAARGGEEQSLIQRVIAQTTRSGLAIRAVREMRAGTVGGKHTGWMRVATQVTPAGGFSWNVLEEGGSNRTREKVFRAVLDSEAETWRHGDRDAAALTPANYTFTRIGTSPSGEVQLRLDPRRSDARLVQGTLTVSSDGYPVQLDGKLAKSPSFWVKSVTIVKRYGRFAGVALPTMLESTADLKVVGKSTFTMRYSYHEVNGRIFPQTAASTDLDQ